MVVTPEVSQRITGHRLCLREKNRKSRQRELDVTLVVTRENKKKMLTAAFFVAVVNAVVHAVAARPQGDAAVVCLAGELSFPVTLVVWTPWMRRQ